jgi:outer membrane lipoprotein SlyB
MAARSRHSSLGTPLSLALVFILVCLAGLAAVVGWVGLSVEAGRATSLYRDLPSIECRICGVVEQVRELGRAGNGDGVVLGPVENGLMGRGPGLQFGGGRGDGAAVLIAAIGGMMAGVSSVSPPPKIYETTVLLDDGSVRVLREAGLPPWKPGDRVKVMRGRIEPLG